MKSNADRHSGALILALVLAVVSQFSAGVRPAQAEDSTKPMLKGEVAKRAAGDEGSEPARQEGTIDASKRDGNGSPLSGEVSSQSGTVTTQTGTVSTQTGTVTTQSGLGNPQSGRLDSDKGHKHKLTAQDYRQLEFGILGLVVARKIQDSKWTVAEVLPGCPAALAGIQPGDVEVQVDDHVLTRAENQRSYWLRGTGRAGSSVVLKFDRNGMLLTFHLVRMNIEDIKDDKLRHKYERQARKLGEREDP